MDNNKTRFFSKNKNGIKNNSGAEKGKCKISISRYVLNGENAKNPNSSKQIISLLPRVLLSFSNFTIQQDIRPFF